MERLIAKNGKVNGVAEYLVRAKGHWLAVPSSSGRQAKPPCARVSVLKSAAGIDVTKMYPVKAEYIPEMDEWTWETHLKAAEACQKVGMAFAIGLGTTGEFHRHIGCAVRCLRRGPDRCEGQRHRRFRRDARGVGACVAAGEGPAAGRGQLRRRLEQSRVDLRQERADLESALGLGGRETRCAAGGGGLLDLLGAQRTEGTVRAILTVVLGRLAVLAEQDGGEGTYRVPDGARTGGTALRGGGRLRYPPYAGMLDFKVWADVEPPRGTVFNYPVRPTHQARRTRQVTLRRRISPCRFTIGASIRPCSPSCKAASPFRRSSPGQRMRWRASCADSALATVPRRAGKERDRSTCAGGLHTLIGFMGN